MLSLKSFFTKLNLPLISHLLHFSTSPAIRLTNFRNSLTHNQVSQEFKEWFKSGHKPLFNQIFDILQSHKDSEDAFLDSSLSRLNLKLSESFVLEIFNYFSNHIHTGHSRKFNLSTYSTESFLCCLRFFEWAARQANFQHTRATFNAIFRILSQDKLMDFLDHYTQHRYMYNVRFHDVLVMGYAIAGKPEIALQLFSRMRFTGIDLDRFAYHVLLNALVKEDFYEVFDVIVKQIRMRGYEGEITHSIVMKSLVKRNMLDEAKKYLRELCEQGTLKNGYVVGALVDGFCKAGRFEEAGSLIDEFGGCGIAVREHAYGVLIRDLVQAGKLDWAMKFFSKKKLLEGYVPHVFKYNLLISRLLKENRLQEVFDLLVEMKELKVLPDKVTMNTALCFFCKAGMVDIAIDLFKSREEFGLYPNTMAYNYLINTLCEDHNTDVAFHLLMSSSHQKEYFPGKRALSILANTFRRQGKLNEMNELIRICIERQILLSENTYQKVITSLCKARNVKDGYTIYEYLNRLNVVPSDRTFISLIEGFLSEQRGDILAKLLIEMQEKGHTPQRRHFQSVISCLCSMDNSGERYLQLLRKQLSRHGPDRVIFNFFIEGAGHGKKPELAKRTFEMMTQSGIAPNLRSEILMLQSYLKSAKISDAIYFFDDIRNRRQIRSKLYNTMVVGLCKASQPEIALDYLNEMKINNVTPSIECYESLVHTFLLQEKYAMAVHIINILESDRVKVSTFIGNLLLFHALKGNKLYNGWRSSSRDLSYGTSSKSLLDMLISTFSRSFNILLDAEQLEEVIGQCFPLDTFTYNMLLEKLCISHIDQARELFRKMGKKGHEPNIFTYRILLRGLRKHDLHDEADSLKKEMNEKEFMTSQEDSDYV